MPLNDKDKNRVENSLQNNLGNLLVAQFHLSQVKQKINGHFPSEDRYQESIRYLKLDDSSSGQQWYKLTARLEKIPLDEVDPTAEKQANYTVENVLGQMMITEYQIHKIKERLAYIVDNDGTTSDTFMMKQNDKWYDGFIRLEQTKTTTY